MAHQFSPEDWVPQWKYVGMEEKNLRYWVREFEPSVFQVLGPDGREVCTAGTWSMANLIAALLRYRWNMMGQERPDQDDVKGIFQNIWPDVQTPS